MGVPLHVTNTSHRLELRVASAILVEVPVVTLLQQILAPTVSGELVSHPAGGEGKLVSLWEGFDESF